MKLPILLLLMVTSVAPRSILATDVASLAQSLKWLAQYPKFGNDRAAIGNWMIGILRAASPWWPFRDERLIDAIAADSVGKDTTAVLDKLEAIGNPAIPYLMPLLADQDEQVSGTAGYAMRNMTAFTVEHLETCMDACRRGSGHMFGPIARIGNDRAADFIFDELIRTPKEGPNVDCIPLLGEKAVSRVLKIYQTPEIWRVQDGSPSARGEPVGFNETWMDSSMRSVLSKLGEKSAAIVDPLVAIAADEKIAMRQRIGAVDALSYIGVFAEKAVAELQKLRRHRNKDLEVHAAWAIVRVGSTDAAQLLLEELEQSRYMHSSIALSEFPKLGTRAKSVGPALVRYLDSSDWKLRAEIAAILGDIGDERVADALIGLLDQADDWRLAYIATGALARIKAARAETPLFKTPKSHWYPPVREAASAAIESIRTGVAMKAPTSKASTFFFRIVDEPFGSNVECLDEEDAAHIRFPIRDTPRQLMRIPVMVKGMLMEKDWPGTKVEDGWLVGYNYGKWGGGIEFVDEHRKAHSVHQAENTIAIHLMGKSPIAVSAMSDLREGGCLYRLSAGPDGKWVATKWRVLPGSPYDSWLLEDGNLLVNCLGGIVLVSPDGTMKSLTRKQALRDDAPKP